MKIHILLAALLTGTLSPLTIGVSHAQAPNSAPPATAAPGEPAQSPLQIIQQKLRSGVATRLAELGASVEDLQVSVAAPRQSATPFKVRYRGLRNFTGSDGTTPEANGVIVMKYIGGGQWQGALAGTQFTVAVGAKDNIDLPFVDDPPVLGAWESVDFVSDIAAFNPQQPAWKAELYLKGLTFLANGKTPQPWWTWTKGVLIHHGDQTASRYEIREIGGVAYLFLEWKSGDVMIAGLKPHYYVLKPKAKAAL